MIFNMSFFETKFNVVERVIEDESMYFDLSWLAYSSGRNMVRSSHRYVPPVGSVKPSAFSSQLIPLS